MSFKNQTWTGTCPRCDLQATAYTESVFGDVLICVACKGEEKKLPEYAEALRAKTPSEFPGLPAVLEGKKANIFED